MEVGQGPIGAIAQKEKKNSIPIEIRNRNLQIRKQECQPLHCYIWLLLVRSELHCFMSYA
jgi:hypothetical protein